MKSEDQVASFEPSRRLKQLGVRQDSQCYWVPNQDGSKWILTRPYQGHGADVSGNPSCSAFTVAELGDILPYGINSYKNPEGLWECVVQAPGDKKWKIIELKEADARAKMLIYLLEKGFIKP